MNVATTAGSGATVSRPRAALDPRGGDDPLLNHPFTINNRGEEKPS